MQKLLITGASGLLGKKIVKDARHNYEVVPTHNTKPLHSNSLKLEITNLNEALSSFNKLEPNIVIHEASETNADKCETEKEHACKTNVEGTRNMAEACENVNAKLVFISTDYIFDGEEGFTMKRTRRNP